MTGNEHKTLNYAKILLAGTIDAVLIDVGGDTPDVIAENTSTVSTGHPGYCKAPYGSITNSGDSPFISHC